MPKVCPARLAYTNTMGRNPNQSKKTLTVTKLLRAYTLLIFAVLHQRLYNTK